jgi:transposase-like protein
MLERDTGKEGEGRVWKRLTAERKLEVYRATRDPNAPVGEILRKAGMTLEQLRQIEETVEASALVGLKARNGTPTEGPVSPAEHEQLKYELREKEKALAELSLEYTLLKKAERLGLWRPRAATTAQPKEPSSETFSGKRRRRG